MYLFFSVFSVFIVFFLIQIFHISVEILSNAHKIGDYVYAMNPFSINIYQYKVYCGFAALQ